MHTADIIYYECKIIIKVAQENVLHVYEDHGCPKEKYAIPRRKKLFYEQFISPSTKSELSEGTRYVELVKGILWRVVKYTGNKYYRQLSSKHYLSPNITEL